MTEQIFSHFLIFFVFFLQGGFCVNGDFSVLIAIFSFNGDFFVLMAIFLF